MANAPANLLQARLARVRAALCAEPLEAFVVTHLPNVFYLTGFDGTAATLVVTATDVHFITDFRYLAACEALLASGAGCPGARLVPVEGSYDQTLASVLSGIPGGRIGIEAARMPVSRYRWLASALGLPDLLGGAAAVPGAAGRALVPTERIVEEARLRKDDHEIATLRTAGRMLAEVAAAAAGEVRAGRAEREVAASIDFLLKQAGFDRPAFDTIVASGENGAQPHARPGPRRLAPGDLIVLDFGGVYGGYCVDLTRTVSLGPQDGEAVRVHRAVLEANRAALAATRPGVAASTVDGAARAVLTAHGLGDAFGHATGHGLGAEVHEEPRIGPARGGLDQVLEAGMVFTIEPGVYLPGWGGVRIEDDVLVTAGGCEILTDCPRELLEP